MSDAPPSPAAGPAAAPLAYRSTRGAPGVVGFAQALLAGLAPDGGLYLPERLPPLPAGWEAAASVAELARLVLPPFVGEAGAEAVADALGFDMPVVALGDDFVLELFHGPTAAFKDVGARSLARLMDAALAGAGRRATVLVATSGDTGGAVADAFAGLPHARVALLYPDGGVSPRQEEQLTVAREGVRAFAVRGSFDDCQRLVKGAFADPALAGLGLTSANSINVGRLLPQTLYHLWGVAEVRRRLGANVTPRVVVPSGNLGNLAAGLMAQAMGLPVAGFVAAHNRNDFFPRFLAGTAAADAFAPSVATLSNAMDVGAPSNFERLAALFGARLPELVTGEAVDDAATLARMRLTHERFGYLACPHTAVGLEAAARTRARSAGAGPDLVLATAHPAKFPEAVERATGVTPATPPALAAAARAPKRVERLAADGAALRAALLDWG
ncbi:MAG: threonine synthase [Deinococcales bacterium]|nr:threonine synthase [Deinococcales bacterium]